MFRLKIIILIITQATLYRNVLVNIITVSDLNAVANNRALCSKECGNVNNLL